MRPARLLDARIPKAGRLTLRLLARRVVAEMRRDHLRAFAGNLAFRGIFAISALLVLAVVVLKAFDARHLLGSLLDQLSVALPNAAVQTLREDLVQSKATQGDPNDLVPLTISIVAAIYALSATARGVIDALNAMYEVEERRPFLTRVSVSVVMALVVFALLLAALVTIGAGPDLVRSAFDGWQARALIALRWPLLVFFVLLAHALAYYFAPAVEERFRLVTHGTIVAVPAWVLFSAGFSAYADNVGDFARYGGLAGVVVLLLYMFFASAILLFGAQINDVIRREVADRRSPSAAVRRPPRRS